MRAPWLLLFGLTTLAACAADGADADEQAESGEDALSSAAVASYEAVAPPEERVARTAIAAKLGAPIGAGARLSVIRTLTWNGRASKVVVDADTMLTSLVETPALEAGTSKTSFDGSPYERSLASLAAGTRALESLGPDAPREAAEQFTLTVDMCQSSKPWEKRLFDWLVALADQRGEPTAVGIAMTGGWAKNHPAELEQIAGWESRGKLAITWVNHSSTHPLHCKNSSCSQATFLTEPSVNLEEEVFGLERSLLARGLVPSPLFRFPGLVHDRTRLQQLSRLSLMPLDSDAWIAKGQPIKDGAVVLVHGNGNEAVGITGFLRQVQTGARAANLASGTSKLVSPLLAAPTPPTE